MSDRKAEELAALIGPDKAGWYAQAYSLPGTEPLVAHLWSSRAAVMIDHAAKLAAMLRRFAAEAEGGDVIAGTVTEAKALLSRVGGRS